jgi:hypothetical protein
VFFRVSFSLTDRESVKPLAKVRADEPLPLVVELLRSIDSAPPHLCYPAATWRWNTSTELCTRDSWQIRQRKLRKAGLS